MTALWHYGETQSEMWQELNNAEHDFHDCTDINTFSDNLEFF